MLTVSSLIGVPAGASTSIPTSGGAGAPPVVAHGIAPTSGGIIVRGTAGGPVAPTPVASIYTYTANIVSYNAATKIATLDKAINVSIGYNSYYGVTDSQYSINGGPVTSYAQALYLGNNTPQLSTDENGNFVGIFNVPSTTFRAGQRILRVDNRTVSSDPTTATTFAEATFTVSGLSGNAQNQDFAPSVDSSAGSFTQTSQQSNQVVNTISTLSPYDPLAQTFMISKDNFPNGVFISSIKLFFAAVPTTGNFPVTLSIVNTLNGYPNGQILDYSTVVLGPSQILVSSTPHYLDPTTFTEFMFPAPVYVQPGVLYAVLLQSNSPDYQVYYAQQNQVAIPSTAKALPSSANPSNPTKIGTAPYIGALFESQNGITWTADQTKDLMFVIDRCVFNTSVQPQIQFVVPQGMPLRKLGINDVIYKINANNVPNLFGNYYTDLLVDAINVTTTDLIPTDTSIGYTYSATVYNGSTITTPTQITPGRYGTPSPTNTLFNDGQGARVLSAGVNTSFSLYATLSSSDPDVSPVVSDDGVTLYTIDYIINNMGLGNNNIAIISGGTGYNVNTATATASTPDTGASPAVLGLTTNTSTGAITSVYVLSPGSGYLTTPTITISDPTTRSGNANATVVVYGETSASGGNGMAKYFTKKVVLSPGNDSGDMRVFYTAYRPVGTNIYVYYKILSSSDTSVFETGNWQLMTQVGNGNAYSSSLTDLIEYECAPGLNGTANNNISYTNSSGQTYTSFIQFAIKVVMSTPDNTNVPFLTDIRALALPPGTGI